MNTSNSWSGQDPTLSSAPQDDFQFLDMGMSNLGDGLNFDFPDFSVQENGQMLHHDGGEAMDTSGMEGEMNLLNHKAGMMQPQMVPSTSAPGHSTIPSAPAEMPQDSSIVELDAQIQYLQQQRHNQQQRRIQEQQRNFYVHQNMVPPTPNSAEMHGNAQFYHQSGDSQQSAMYERFQLRLKENEMAFTPLVSPAVTPLEAHFNIPEYTVPGAYFSPLSSPALHAQNEHRSVYDARHVDTSSTPSPNDMNVDSGSGPTSTGPTAKRTTKKPISKPRTPRATARGVRQSPISKPQRRRTGSTNISQQALTELSEPAMQQSNNASSARSTASTEESNDSVSPEHLSDMAPPPLPGSAGRSPFLASQNGHNGHNGHNSQNGQNGQNRQNGQDRVQQIKGMSPATPASLMRISKPNQTSPAIGSNGEMDDHAMEGFSLPEAAHSTRPQISRIDTRSDGQTTPTLDSASRTPSFASLPSPAFVRPTTSASSASPQLLSMNGSSNGIAASRKTPQLGVRGSKKRSSVSSVHVSPALRPKISPSIRPLISGGSSHDDTASLLLASKSNYQNILEGTHLPGVNYPTELSTNLTSKRTSHKIAEQGRRNRINSALQEIATLLPKDGPSSGNEKSGSGEGGKDLGDDTGGKAGAAQSANSKASTVELAIEYIKQLQKEVEDANKRAEEFEKKLKERDVVEG